MATVACPDCGLPRVEAELGSKPCPVCDAPPLPAGPRPKPKSDEPDPTAGLPADASELYAAKPRANAPGAGRPAVLAVAAATFLFGTLVGAGGVLGVQAVGRAKPNDPPGEVADAGNTPPADANPQPAPGEPTPNPQPNPPAVAQPKVEPQQPIPVAEPTPDPEPDAKNQQAPPPAGRTTIVELNQPDGTYFVPFAMKKGEHVVLKGKVKILRVNGLDAGAILDASGLEVSTINVGGKIDNGSTLKLSCPKGVVNFPGKIDGKSVVEINAPDGDVKFLYATTAAKEGSKIDGGSTVSITGRNIEFKGEITGDGTKVNITLSRNAWLKVGAVSGKAVVEYKPQMAGWSPPDVSVGAVAATATFRKAGDRNPNQFDPNEFGPDGVDVRPGFLPPNPPDPRFNRPRLPRGDR